MIIRKQALRIPGTIEIEGEMPPPPTPPDDDADAAHSQTISVRDLVAAASVVAPATTAAAGVAIRATTSSAEGPQVLANRYELLGMLGSGAMGTVYRARDRELDEVVALKVLKKELATTEMIDRFRREVKLARRVTHKNVARTYDISAEPTGGADRFLTMEFIDGEMLGSLLARRHRLPIPEVIQLGLDVCAGLAAAHAANVLHRDLKPENVIIAKEPGRGAVITDFGIARAVAEGELSQTVGGIVGTPAYMAPEQVEGATDLDARADLYALGTMLYELLTGEIAWNGDSIVTVAAGRLLRPPPDPRKIMPALPEPLAALILKLMSRHREDRFANADEVAAALMAFSSPMSSSSSSSSAAAATSISALPPARMPRTGTVPLAGAAPPGTVALTPLFKPRTPNARVVAVLPVLNLGHKDDDYLVDSVNEDVTDSLSMVPSLLVRPRGETMKYIDPSRDVREVGRALGVDVVVDASVRRIGETVRASFRLIAVEDGFQLWARRFDRTPAEVLSIADDAAQAIAGALTTEDVSNVKPARAHATDPETQDLYLRGRYLLRRAWHGSMTEALDLLSRAAASAPDDPVIVGTYALALARVYGLESYGREVADRSRTLAARALELDPRSAEAKVALASVHLMNGEGHAAIGFLREALTVAPNTIEALDWLGRVAGEVDRLKDGLLLLERAFELAPDAVAIRLQIARLLAMTGDREGASARIGPMPEHPSDIAAWFFVQARDATWFRDLEKAKWLKEELEKSQIPKAARFAMYAALDIALGNGARLADRALTDQVLPVDNSRPPRRASFNAQMRAELHLSLGNLDEAIEMIAASDANGLLDVVWLSRCPLLEPIRANPKFIVLRDRVVLRAERVAAAFDTRIESTSFIGSAHPLKTLSGRKSSE